MFGRLLKFNQRNYQKKLNVNSFQFHLFSISSCSFSSFSSSSILNNSQENDLSSSDNKNWNWVPPRQTITPTELNDNILEIIEGKNFTPEEISLALEKLRGIDIKTINIKGKLFSIDYFVICSAESQRHIQTIADVLVKSIRDRKLIRAPSYKFGAEGELSTHWLAVDLGNIVVHIMMPKTRSRFNIEAHWTTDNRPVAVYQTSRNARKARELYETQLEDLCNQFPPPRDEDDDEAYLEGISEGGGIGNHDNNNDNESNSDNENTDDNDYKQEIVSNGKHKNKSQQILFNGKSKGDKIRINPLHSSGFTFSPPPKEYTQNKE